MIGGEDAMAAGAIRRLDDDIARKLEAPAEADHRSLA